jgi:hypothetical protein
MCICGNPLFSSLVHPDEIAYRAVICFFDFFCEKASRQFSHAPVVMETFTAPVLSVTRLIGAIAVLHEFFLNAFHVDLLL